MAGSHKRSQVRQFPTPLYEDLIFYETVDSNVAVDFPFEYGTPHPNQILFPHHILVYSDAISSRSGDSDGTERRYYAKVRDNQHNYNWETVIADIGGVKFDAVTFTYVFLRSEFNQQQPLPGDVCPHAPWVGYLFSEKVQRRIGEKELDSMFIVEQHTYFKRETFYQHDYDEWFGMNLYSIQTLYYSQEIVPGTGLIIDELIKQPDHEFWDLKDDGTTNEGRNLTANWFMVTNREQVPWEFIQQGGRKYYTNIDFSWPPVLEGIEIMDWVLLSGDTHEYPRPYYLREGYSGPTKAYLEDMWSKDPFPMYDAVLAPDGIIMPQVMQPRPIVYSCPFYALSIGACLHLDVVCKADTGNADPIFDQNVGSARLFKATIPTDWYPQMIIQDEQKPFKGGYLRSRVTVYRPYELSGSSDADPTPPVIPP